MKFPEQRNIMKKKKTKKAEYRPWETSVFKGQKRVGIVKDVLSTR